MGRVSEIIRRTSSSEVIDPSYERFKLQADQSVQKLRTPVGNALVYDIRPKDNLDAPPVLLLNGYGVNLPRYSRMKAIVDSGLRAITVHPQPTGGGWKMENEEIYGRETVRKAKLLEYTAEKKGISESAGIAVSGGTPALLTAAITKPGLFTDIVYLNANMRGPLSERELAMRFCKKVFSTDLQAGQQELTPGQVGWEFVEHHVINPVRAKREIRESAYTDVFDLSQKALSMGIRVSAVYAANDPIFPPNEMFYHIERKKAEYGDKLLYFPIIEVPGGHDEVSPLNPERIKLATDLLMKYR